MSQLFQLMVVGCILLSRFTVNVHVNYILEGIAVKSDVVGDTRNRR